MTKRLSRADRQEIIREFAMRHNGVFNPRLFRDEVRERGPDHPAHPFFTWDEERAADRYQVEQAREFARGLKIKFSVQTVMDRDWETPL